MATRNQRRKAKKARDRAKQKRLNGVMLGKQKDYVQEIVRRNLSSPPQREAGNIRSCLSNLGTQSHRGYVCRASGSMNRQRALALQSKNR